MELTEKPSAVRTYSLYALAELTWAGLQATALRFTAGVNWSTAVADGLISASLLTLFALTIRNTLRYYRPGPQHAVYLFLGGIILSYSSTLATHSILNVYFPGETSYLQYLTFVRSLIFFLVTGVIFSLHWLWYSLQGHRVDEQRKADAEKMAREAELRSLHQQLQPHFLFNSLNSINALVSVKPEEARKMLQQLSDFLRGTVKKDSQQSVPLGDELKQLRLYLEIEKVRFGHRLEVVMDCDESSLKMKLPPLLLQPVVENAIKFGLYDTLEALTIKLTTRNENNHLVAVVENPFDPETAATRPGTGFGLASLQRRLFLLFSRNDLLSTEKKENRFITRLKIPQE